MVIFHSYVKLPEAMCNETKVYGQDIDGPSDYFTYLYHVLADTCSYYLEIVSDMISR